MSLDKAPFDTGVDGFDQSQAEALDILRNTNSVVFAVGDVLMDGELHFRVSDVVAPNKGAALALAEIFRIQADRLEEV